MKNRFAFHGFTIQHNPAGSWDVLDPWGNCKAQRLTDVGAMNTIIAYERGALTEINGWWRNPLCALHN